MTFRDAIENARSELGDTFSGSYSYSDEDMFRYATEGVREAWKMRSSLRYDEDLRMYSSRSLTQNTVFINEGIPLPDDYVGVVAYYIVYRCLSRDITDAGNAEAAKVMFERFVQLVMG